MGPVLGLGGELGGLRVLKVPREGSLGPQRLAAQPAQARLLPRLRQGGRLGGLWGGLLPGVWELGLALGPWLEGLWGLLGGFGCGLGGGGGL